MSLVGTYQNGDSGAVLEITTVNDTTGQGSGNFTLGNVCVQVSVSYHFIPSSNGGGTTILFRGAENDPNYYTGASGFGNDTAASIGIRLAGGITLENIVVPFSGLFVKQQA